MTLRQLIADYERMEQPNLLMPGAIWDVHLAKLLFFMLALLLAKYCPALTSLPW